MLPRPAGAARRPYRTQDLDHPVQRYADLYDLAPNGYVSFDRSGRIEEINLTAAQLFGIPRDRLIGMPFKVLVSREDIALFLDHLLHCRASDKRVETELHLKNRSGEIILAHLASSPMTSSMRDGALLYQTAIVDLTERKRAEEAVSESEKRYRTLFDLVPTAIYTCDANGLILEFNQRAAKLWGRKPKTNNPKEKYCGSFKIFYPDGRRMPHKDCPMGRALRGEEVPVSEREILVEREDGERRIVAVSPTALRNEYGKIIGAINCLYDVTEPKKAEEALRQSEEFHRALVSQTNVGMVRSDRSGRFAFVNQTFCEMLGYKETELIGKKIADITHPDDLKETRRLFQRIVRTGAPYQSEKRYLRKDGSFLWVNVSASPIGNARGKTQSAIAVIVDITDRKKAEAGLRKSQLQLEELVERRTRALRVANVELKNEINSRKGLEGEILKVTDREQQRLGRELHDGLCQELTAIGFMAQSAALRLEKHRVVDAEELKKIAKLVSDSAMEARMIARDLHKEQIEAASFERALRNLIERKIWSTPCQLRLQTKIEIDNDRAASEIYRILREAIINANKHARATRIIVSARRHERDLAISVEDDGVGLNGKDLTSEGLGFQIIKYRAKMIGARVKVESPHKGGTRVTIYLPDGAHSSDPSN
jgi:PAS domain S-box-containing protein